MKHLFTLLLTIIISSASAQFISNPYFMSAHPVPCPGNPNVMVNGFDEWKIYQTTNDLWDGPIDSNICINAWNTNSNINARIALSEVDTTRHLFLVSNFNANSDLLQPDYVYNAWLEMYNQIGDFPVNPSWNCANGPCSFIEVNVQVPDSFYTGIDYRHHVLSLDSNGASFTIKCFPSEKFDTQRVTQMIVGLTVKDVAPNDTLIFTYADIQPVFDFIVPVTEVDAYQVIDTEYAYNFDFGTYLLLYTDSTYPSPPHISYVYAYPGNNQQLTPQHITITIGPQANYVVQCYTDLRGAPVNGSPGEYHHVTLVDDGGHICLNMIGDKPFHSDDAFYFKSGMIDFGGILSCLVFHNGSTFSVADGATMNYGDESNFGVLSIRDKTNLVIGKNATLNIFNRMFLFEENPNGPPQQFYMTLNPTSTLRFMPGSHLSNLFSIDNTIRLNVYMKGGLIDDSGLPEANRELINRIYEPDDLPAKITVYPLPAGSTATVRINAPNDETTTLILSDALGSKYNEQKIHLLKGINEFPFSLEGMSSGIYFLKVNYNNTGEQTVANVVKGN